MIKVRFQANKRLDLKLMSLCSVEPIITGIPISREHIYAQCLKKNPWKPTEFLAKKVEIGLENKLDLIFGQKRWTLLNWIFSQKVEILWISS